MTSAWAQRPEELLSDCVVQTPPDLVVKFQPIDIIAVILWLVW